MNSREQAFRTAASIKTSDRRHRSVIQKATGTYHAQVARGRERFASWDTARNRVAATKWETTNHLDRYLELFEQQVLANGGQVHWAETAASARSLILAIARAHRVKQVVKSKSMTTEEIKINEALDEEGIRVLETDLGEYICQLRGEPPYHIVTPVMHLTKQDIARTFHDKLNTPPTDSAEELTMIAREKLRSEFLSADMGITGANFAIAETGMVAITENEGNARLTFSLPRVHVAVVGIEKVIPRFEDLALFWPVLSTAGTGQALTAYNSVVGGPRRDGETDGPDAFHVILLDNGRTRLLADAEQRDALHCIRCGACLNACPIFRNVGGHGYGTTYQGPIGAVITPHLEADDTWGHLPFASSLCGACTEVCPAGIDLHHHLLHHRRNFVGRRQDGPAQRLAFRLWFWVMNSVARYRLAAGLGRFLLRLGVVAPFLRRWTATREFPVLPRQTFRDWWAQQEKQTTPKSTSSGAAT